MSDSAAHAVQMTAAGERQPSGVALSVHNILAVMLVAGCFNGLMAEMGESWTLTGLDSLVNLFGIGYFYPIIIGVAGWNIWQMQSEALQRHDIALITLGGLMFAAVVLVPSSLGSWVAVGVYALVLALLLRGTARHGAMMFVALAVCALWIDFGFKLFVGPLTVLDTIMTEHVLHLFGVDVTRLENVLTRANGFSIVVLADCSSWKDMPLVILAYATLVKFTATASPLRKFWQGLLMVFMLTLLINLARLALISLSLDLHTLIHDARGRNIFDMARTLVVFAGVWWATR